MGIFSKLKFWKKDDDLDFDGLADKSMNHDLGLNPNMPQDNLGLNEKSPFDQPQPSPYDQQPVNPYGNVKQSRNPLSAPQPPLAAPSGRNRDFELINSKLDTIKAVLTSMDQRIANLEKAAGVEEQKQRLW